MDFSRRSLLTKALLGGAAIGTLAMAGCTTAQIAQFESQWATIVDQIQQDVATAAALVQKGLAYIPSVESVAEEAAAILGPQWQAMVAAGEVVVNQVALIVEAFINAATSQPPAAQAKLHAKLKYASVTQKVIIGRTPQGITVIGYRVG